MGGINVKRWLIAGTVGGVLFWVIEGVAAMLFYMDQMEASLTAHNLSMEMNAQTTILSVVVSLLAAYVIVFFYAAARPRFGPGPKTAIIVGTVLWFGTYLLTLIGYHMLGLYPTSLLITWGIVGLGEMILVSLVGGAIYKEEPAPRAT